MKKHISIPSWLRKWTQGRQQEPMTVHVDGRTITLLPVQPGEDERRLLDGVPVSPFSPWLTRSVCTEHIRAVCRLPPGEVVQLVEDWLLVWPDEAQRQGHSAIRSEYADAVKELAVKMDKAAADAFLTEKSLPPERG